MIRDFSNAKKEELYRNLDVIDNKEWRPFMIWCGGRAGEFGVWADKLGISSYTRQIDNYQNRVLNTNDSTRNQIDVIFENVTETDRRYAEIFCGHAETVKEQMARVQAMIQVMNTVNGNEGDRDIATLLQDVADTFSTCVSTEKYNYTLESGREILERRLKGEENIDQAEWEKICEMIEEEQPNMLINLYITDCNSSADADKIYAIIMDYYKKHKMDITIEDVKDLDFEEEMDQTQKETFVACWNRLGQMGLSKEQIIAVMANIYAESRFSATNAQESYGYVGLYDDYEYRIDDGVGYGICQWTLEQRKDELLNYANNNGCSVHDLETQLNYFQYEMEEGICSTYWKKFLEKTTMYDAMYYFMDEIENPLVNNTEERMEYATVIEAWYSELE